VDATVVLSAFDVLQYPLGGGHFSAYLQYVYGLQAIGCEVWWLERIGASDDPVRDRRVAAELSTRLADAGLPDRLIVYTGNRDEERRYLTMEADRAETLFARADLVLNFNYEISPELLARFRRTALIDIDPGLLQLWMHNGDLAVARHDLHFTTGDTVGTPAARFAAGGVDWIHIRPPVSLDRWPVVRDRPRAEFTTVSSWSSDEWATDGEESVWYENSKRASFLEYLGLPEVARVPLELALNLDDDERQDIALLESHGWRVCRAEEVAATPTAYRTYVQQSAGEFSCAKPSCMHLQNAWVSDRTICYLASGRPAVVQHTGPSDSLDGGRGILRFTTLEQAAEALESVATDYDGHCSSAREVAETYFDARKIAAVILEAALGAQPIAPCRSRA
jgi:hypothetical protein